ncbi:hypothetical protein TRVA0_026S02014 [Trichomonascus vanleenenianus]|uniref:F-box protein n=1 Tax=Trichomonascus vanleenenianus TaxID=2268995 RepID=UPI003EC9CBEF
MDRLPTELLLLVFQNLYSAKEAARCSQACQRFGGILTDPSHDETIYGPNGISKRTFRHYWPWKQDEKMPWRNAATRAVVNDMALNQTWFVEYEDIEQDIESAINCWREYEQDGVEAIYCTEGMPLGVRWTSNCDTVYAYSYQYSRLVVLDLNRGEFGMMDSDEDYRIKSTPLSREGWATVELPYLFNPAKYLCAVTNAMHYSILFHNNRLGYLEALEAGDGAIRIGVSAPNEVVEYVWTGGENLVGSDLLFNSRYIFAFRYSQKTVTIIEPSVSSSSLMTRLVNMPDHTQLSTLDQELTPDSSDDDDERFSTPPQFVLTDSHLLCYQPSSRTLHSCQMTNLLGSPEAAPIEWQTVLKLDEQYSNLEWRMARDFTTEDAVTLIGKLRKFQSSSNYDNGEPSVACVIPLNRVAKPIVYCQLRDSAAWVLHKSGKVSHLTRSSLDGLASLYDQLNLTGMVPIESITK